MNAALFSSDGKRAYLVYPRESKIRMVDLATMRPAGEMTVGAVPVALGVRSSTLAVADPSAKRVWMVEGTQSFSQAFARGFLRGLIGLGLGGARDAQFPTGVDRVLMRGSRWVAYDSSSGTLYRFARLEPVGQLHVFCFQPRSLDFRANLLELVGQAVDDRVEQPHQHRRCVARELRLTAEVFAECAHRLGSRIANRDQPIVRQHEADRPRRSQ